MPIKRFNKNITFRCIEISFEKESYVCPVCGLEANTLKQAGITQRAIANSYRKAVGLLTGNEILEMRKNLDLTQKALADKMTIGIVSIKRWEGSIIQSQSMDKILRMTFTNSDNENNYPPIGNIQFQELSQHQIYKPGKTLASKGVIENL